MNVVKPLDAMHPASPAAGTKPEQATDDRGGETAIHPAEHRDQWLVRRVRQGDERAFEELVATYQHRIFGLIFRMVGNRQEAEDLAQEVFISAYRALPSYRGEGRLYTWLYRIATNTCRNRIKYLKGRHYHQAVPVEGDVPLPTARSDVPTTSAQLPNPEQMVEGRRLEDAVSRELQALDEDHRLLIVLRDLEGLTYQDIMGITGLQEGTLKSRLHRARLALKERLKDYLR